MRKFILIHEPAWDEDDEPEIYADDGTPPWVYGRRASK